MSMLDELDKQKLSMSGMRVAKITKKDPYNAEGIRTLTNFLIEIIHKNRDHQEEIANELVSLGNEEKNVTSFITKVLSLKEETLKACEILSDIERYMLGLKHLRVLNSHIDHTFLYNYDDEGRPDIMFPLIKFTLQIADRRSLDSRTVIDFQMDPNSLEVLIERLKIILGQALGEAERLKRPSTTRVIDTVR